MRITFHISEDASRNSRKHQKTIKITREIWSKPLWVKLCKFLQVLNRINIESKHTRMGDMRRLTIISAAQFIGKFFMLLFQFSSIRRLCARCSFVQWFPFSNRIIRAHNQDCPGITFWRDRFFPFSLIFCIYFLSDQHTFHFRQSSAILSGGIVTLQHNKIQQTK